MVRWIAGLIAAGILLVGCSGAPLNPRPYDGYKGENTHWMNEAWSDACRLSRYDCRGLQKPRLRYSKLISMHGAWGMYTGGTTVYLAPSMRITKRESQAYLVLVHEVVHYIETKVNRAPNGRMSVCLSEEEAFSVDGELAREMGLPHLDRSVDWIKQYWKCNPRTLLGLPPEDDGES